MTEDTRDTVIKLDRQRRDLRAHLTGDVEQAKLDLHPRTLARRWTDRKRAQMADIADSGKHAFKKNAPLIGLAGTAILLFAARRPISNAINALRKKAQQAKDRKS
jgi:hypothetical protein